MKIEKKGISYYYALIALSRLKNIKEVHVETATGPNKSYSYNL